MYSIKFRRNEKHISIVEISFFVDSQGVFAILFRVIDGVKEPASYTVSLMDECFSYRPALHRLETELNGKIRDEHVWSDFGVGFDNSVINEIVLDEESNSECFELVLGVKTNKFMDVSGLPPISSMNKLLDRLESIIRDDLGGSTKPTK